MNQPAADQLVARLEAGWRAGHSGPAVEVLHHLQSVVEGQMEVREELADHVEFRLSLPKVRLLGADDIHGIVLGGRSKDAESALSRFMAGMQIPGRINLILAGSSAAYEAAVRKSPPRSAVILRSGQLSKILYAAQPEELLKSDFRRQLGKSRLLPFDIEHPAASNMFLGRQSELEMLAGTSSVAIAGPGRVGKSSLLHQHRRSLVRNRDPRMHHSIFIDFFSLENKSENNVAKFIAMKLNPIRKNTLLGKEDLLRFFRSEKNRLGAAPELMMDEVDEVITLGIFDLLAMAAREGLCRLLIAGKSVLYDTIYRRGSALASRVELVRPRPLTFQECVDLLVQPLCDLGYGYKEPQGIGEAVFDLTGGLPQNIQYLGLRLFKVLESDHKHELTPELLRGMKADFEYAHYARSPFRSLEKELKPIAMELLRYGGRAFDAVAIQEACSRCGVKLPGVLDAADIGDSLVIMNFLVWWGRGAYRLSCPALSALVSST